jgi:hypothetical protein
MMRRSLRRLVALLGILGISFAQFAAAANACVLDDLSGHARGAAAVAAVAPGPAGGPEVEHHCGGHSPAPTPALPGSNLCEVHCSDAATPAVAPDLPAVTLAVLPAPTIALAALAATASPPPAETLARAAAPPIVIAFGRLLI